MFLQDFVLHLKVENCLQSDKSCEVPKFNFSSLMLWIWVGVCTPDNVPHMLQILWKNSSSTHWQIWIYCTLWDLHYETGLNVHVKSASNLKTNAEKCKNTDQLSQHTTRKQMQYSLKWVCLMCFPVFKLIYAIFSPNWWLLILWLDLSKKIPLWCN